MSTQRISDDSVIPNQSNSTSRLPDQSAVGATSRIAASDIVESGGNTSASAIIGSSVPAHLAENLQINLNGHDFKIIKHITSSGEAEIYLLQGSNAQVVLKYYFSNYRPKDEIITRLHALKRRDIMSPLDSGVYQDRFFELSEYMTGGTLDSAMPLTSVDTIKKYAALIAEALNACHQNGIIHRDIKPVNIFFRSPARDEIALGDFGISSALQAGADYRFTNSVNRTTAYAAPELFTNINNQTTLDKKVDYYALGISFLELWLGHDPFKDMAEFMVMRIKIEGRVSIPTSIDHDVQNLIKGLITTEPPKRWGYEEIQKWMRGEFVQVHETGRMASFQPYEWDDLNNVVVDDPKELARLMEGDRKRAVRQLYSRAIPDWVKASSQDMYSDLLYVVENEFPNNTPENAELGVTKAIYILDKERSFKGYDGTVCNSVAEIARHIEANAAHYRDDLKQAHANLYLFLETRGFDDRIKKYQKYYAQFEPEKALNLIVLDLDDNNLVMHKKQYDNIQDLMNADLGIVTTLASKVANKDSKVSLWLDMTYNNMAGAISTWRADTDHRNLETLRYTLQVSGFKLDDKEVTDVAGFSNLLQANLSRFATSDDSAQNISNADYWLTHYKNSSLKSVFATLLFSGNVNEADFLAIYTRVINMAPIDPYPLAIQMAGFRKLNFHNGNASLQNFSDVTSQAFVSFLVSQKSVAVYALDNLEKTVKTLQQIKQADEALAVAILKQLDHKIAADILADLKNIQNNSDSFNAYCARLKDFSAQLVTPIFASLPAITAIDAKLKQVETKKQEIETKYNAQRVKDQKDIIDTFKKFEDTQVEAQIDFYKKFDDFLFIFFVTSSLILFYLIILFNLILFNNSEVFSSILLGFEIAVVIAMFMMIFSSVFKTGRVRKTLTTLLLRPVLKDSNSSWVVNANNARAAVNSQKDVKLKDLDKRTDARINDELFNESVPIMLAAPARA
ncbi:serine/threonine protein kinase [Mucilaginibacter gracilis]|uniref:Serine/threonine protein kinase n=1 Tax=Mucilaginibacter gracilis TaxID=423350 RepID=A0A495J0R4_9SPHI|nr:protein kinase [Mucilaginibacter gracilis]RKR82302.1 serine/threonine protein kinase [Mucilaginibacter gracilis]